MGHLIEVQTDCPPLFPFDLLPTEAATVREAVAAALGNRRCGTVSLGLHSKTQTMGPEQFTVVGDVNVLTKINEVILELVLRSGRPFAWTSFQAHRNVTSTQHIDDGIDFALLIATGDFTAGGLSVEGHGVTDILDRAVYFYPGSPWWLSCTRGPRRRRGSRATC